MEEETKLTVASLSEGALNTLSKMLDNPTSGWRQLLGAMSECPHFYCSEREMTSYSLQVLSGTGSSTRALLARLADRGCSLDLLLQGLRKIEHQEAVQYLTNSVAEIIQITVQPQSQQASLGSRVVLTCRASSPAGLMYQWFRGKEEVPDETACRPELVLCPLSPSHQGHYICRVNQGDKCIFSQWAHVRPVSSVGASPGGSSSTLFPGLESGHIRIIHQPQATMLSEGDTLLLQCNAEAEPPAQYEWYHNKVPLSQHKTGSLRVPCVTTAHRGEYRCKVFNLCQDMWSDLATVIIGPSSITEAAWVEADRGLDSPETHKSAGGQRVNLLNPMISQPPTKQFYATDKIALLIGNMNYHNLPQLAAPIADVHELTNLLRQMDFKVVSLLDLHWQEMNSAVTEFLLLLDKGVYGLLYFAGHGYENYGNSFMIPIDAPASFTSEHCLCVQNILTGMQEKRTGLNVFLLDMCRKRNPHDDVIVQPGLLKVTANIVFGYATCADAEAYELQREDVSNGIFINFLKRRVCEDEKVTVMLDRVAEDMGRCVFTQGRQALELRSNLSERRSLTDQIQSTECSASYSARNLQWAVAHVLPLSKYLQFDCGVTVQLGFAAEFSNVMVIYTRILDKPIEIVSCSAQLTDFPADVDFDLKRSNQETLLEAGSLFMINDELLSAEVPSLYTRILNLQRLKRELTFSVCLEYTYSNMDEEVQERQLVTVGKPLVSKLNLHEPRAMCTSPTSSSFSLDSLKISEYSSFGSSSDSWQCDGAESSMTDSPTTSGSANVAEETDGPELPSGPSKHVDAAKSLSHSQVNVTNYKFSDMFSFHSQ